MKKIFGVIFIIIGGVIFVSGFFEPFGAILVFMGLALGVLGLSMFEKK